MRSPLRPHHRSILTLGFRIPNCAARLYHDRVAATTRCLAGGIELSTDVLDRIDRMVPPGVTINIADNMWDFGTTALDAAFRRR